jgi:Xaa-Pro aminopeptidase
MSTPGRESDERTPLIPPESSISTAKSLKFLDRPKANIIIGLSFLAVLILAGGLTVLFTIIRDSNPIPSASEIQTCAWSELEHALWLLDVPPIEWNEFLARQATLAATLRKEGIDAYIMEPSASSLYYFNVSTSYSLSERPFLTIISSDGSFSVLAPSFEVGRVGGLNMVYDEIRVIEWKEEESPYHVLRQELGNGTTKVMVDEQTRFFITSGLQAANFTVLPVSTAISSIRTVKSQAELRILKGVNQFTAQVIRALQPCIKAGITQEALFDAAYSLFEHAGVGLGFWAIVLFGEQAANPHGGSKGKVLGNSEFVLIDIGSTLYGYGSDVTRTILPEDESISQELLDAWYLVLSAQGAAISVTGEETPCSVVDAASRYVYPSYHCGTTPERFLT